MPNAKCIANAVARFWSKVEKRSPDECWIWQGARFSNGYGVHSAKNKALRAHRFAYEITHGPIPEHLVVMHTCDNRLCVNPHHLTLGTNQDNMTDMVLKGRQSRVGNRGAAYGERNGSAKLTENQVREIRQKYNSGGITLRALCKMYGIGKSAMFSVTNHKTWRHIE